MGYCISDIQTLVIVGATVDPNGYELGRPFTVTHNGLRQCQHHVLDGGCQLLVSLGFGAIDQRDVRLAGSNQHAGIVGAGVAINGDAIERQVGCLTQQRLQQRLRYRCVGSDIAQHGCHVWTNHAGTLGDTGNGDDLTGNLDTPTAALGLGIGGHNAFSGMRPVIFGQVRQCGR